jgi:hypothetical protein
VAVDALGELAPLFPGAYGDRIMNVRVSLRDREVFRRIGEVESTPRPSPRSFRESLAILERLIRRRRSLFGGERATASEDEFRAHVSLYERARKLGSRTG